MSSCHLFLNSRNVHNNVADLSMTARSTQSARTRKSHTSVHAEPDSWMRHRTRCIILDGMFSFICVYNSNTCFLAATSIVFFRDLFNDSLTFSVCRKPIEKVSVQDDANTSLSVDECDPKNPK